MQIKPTSVAIEPTSGRSKPADSALVGEQWKPVVGFEGCYEVSDHGRVRSLARIDVAGRALKGRVLAPAFTKGYQYVNLRVKALGKVSNGARVHRLVLAAFVGPCPDGMECCHSNGNRADNRLRNLRWDTKAANELDKVAHGTRSLPWAARQIELDAMRRRVIDGEHVCDFPASAQIALVGLASNISTGRTRTVLRLFDLSHKHAWRGIAALASDAGCNVGTASKALNRWRRNEYAPLRKNPKKAAYQVAKAVERGTYIRNEAD